MVIAGTGRISAIAAVATRDDDIATGPAGAALVPLVAPVERPVVSRSTARHDAVFITQLIAMAQHGPQTRVVGRAEPQVADAAYRSTIQRNQGSAQASPRTLRVT